MSVLLRFSLVVMLAGWTVEGSTETQEVILPGTNPRENMPWNRFHSGEWMTKADHIFNVFTVSKGLAKFQCRGLASPDLCNLLLFNGDWQDDEKHLFQMQKWTYNEETNAISVSGNADFLSEDDGPRKLKVEGEIHFSGQDSTQLHGVFKCEGGVRFTVDLRSMSVDEVKGPVVKYSFIVTLLAISQLFAYLIFAKDCSESDVVAKPTSRLFLLMTCIIDCGLWLWHMNLAFEMFLAFDYMMIGALWNMFVFLLVHKRLLPIVWLSQNRERMQIGIELFTSEYNAYQNRFFMHVMITVVVFFVFNVLYLLFIFLAHLFFVPQIVSNSTTRERNRIREAIYLTIGISRLTLIMYIFGCPKNFLVWQPKDWFWLLVLLSLACQMSFLYLQNSRRRKWLFAPANSSQPPFDYYAIPHNIPSDRWDCGICLTPLPIPGVDRNSIANNSPAMRPPCGHMFHKDCLRNWMRIKLECPTCRGALPSIEDDDQLDD